MTASAPAPELTIVVCTRNRAATLPACLKALAEIQTKRPYEVLLVDNASTDNTAAIIAAATEHSGCLRTLRVDRIGLGAARDAAWRAARGAIIAFTDDDCYVTPDYVDAMLAVFDEDQNLACAGGRIVLHDSDDLRLAVDERSSGADIQPYRFVPAGTLQGANLALRRSALEAIGGVDPDLGAGTAFPCEDIDMVAAVVWNGMHARYDPRPTVRHHHQRKIADVDRIMAGYDRGRGAYYAKYMLRTNSRAAYRRAWQDVLLSNNYLTHFVPETMPKRLATYTREASAAAEYLVQKQRFLFLSWFALHVLRQYGLVILRGIKKAIVHDPNLLKDPVARAVRGDRLTYLSTAKLQRITRALSETHRLPGDIIEFGVALGGSGIILASHLPAGSRFLGFDVFAMIPPPTSEKDDQKSKERYETICSGQSEGIGGDPYYGYRPDLLSDVKAAFARHGVPVDGQRIQLIQGLFEDTWPAAAPDHIGLVHIDCDWYDPVKYCLNAVADRLTPGGVIVIDDYNDYGGCRTAVDEFIAERPDFVMEPGANPFLRKRSD